MQRVERCVAINVLEPFRRIARGVLELQHFDLALGVILFQRLGEQLAAVQHLRELDRVFDGELGAGADRKVRGVRGVAHQDEIAAMPRLANDAWEVEPG